MRRGEVWFAAVPGGDRPVLVLTRDPVADRIGHLVVATLTRTGRDLVSELALGPEDGMPVESVVSFDNLRETDIRARGKPQPAKASKRYNTSRRNRLVTAVEMVTSGRG